MSAALITGLCLAIAGLIASLISGFSADVSTDVLRHAGMAIFFTFMTLFAHSMMIFYLIGKGRAVREAVTEGELSSQFVADMSQIRRPVFSTGILAIVTTMLAAIVGGGVDVQALPVGVHTGLALCCVIINLVALRAELVAVSSSSRIISEVNRLLESKT